MAWPVILTMWFRTHSIAQTSLVWEILMLIYFVVSISLCWILFLFLLNTNNHLCLKIHFQSFWKFFSHKNARLNRWWSVDGENLLKRTYVHGTTTEQTTEKLLLWGYKNKRLRNTRLNSNRRQALWKTDRRKNKPTEHMRIVRTGRWL